MVVAGLSETEVPSPPDLKKPASLKRNQKISPRKIQESFKKLKSQKIQERVKMPKSQQWLTEGTKNVRASRDRCKYGTGCRPGFSFSGFRKGMLLLLCFAALPSAAAITRATSAACVNNTGPPTGLPLSFLLQCNRDPLSCHAHGNDGPGVFRVEELLETALVDHEDRRVTFHVDDECAAWLDVRRVGAFPLLSSKVLTCFSYAQFQSFDSLWSEQPLLQLGWLCLTGLLLSFMSESQTSAGVDLSFRSDSQKSAGLSLKNRVRLRLRLGRARRKKLRSRCRKLKPQGKFVAVAWKCRRLSSRRAPALRTCARRHRREWAFRCLKLQHGGFPARKCGSCGGQRDVLLRYLLSDGREAPPDAEASDFRAPSARSVYWQWLRATHERLAGGGKTRKPSRSPAFAQSLLASLKTLLNKGSCDEEVFKLLKTIMHAHETGTCDETQPTAPQSWE